MTYYLHIRKPDLSFEILNKYSKAIGHDFSEDIPGINKFLVEEEGFSYKNEPKTLEEALKQRDDWKEKYYVLMEKYLKVVEKES